VDSHVRRHLAGENFAGSRRRLAAVIQIRSRRSLDTAARKLHFHVIVF
jgi:hypothetical protein